MQQDNDVKLITLVMLAFALIAVAIVTSISIGRLRNERNSLVQQTCDYAQVANTDTVTELCTKYQQQTNTVYLREISGKSRLEDK